MSATIAEIEIPVESFAMARTLGRLDGVAAEVQEIVADDDLVSPFVWFDGADPDELGAAFEEDPSIRSYRQLTAKDDGGVLYEMVWTDDVEFLVRATATDGAVLSATSEDDRWLFRVLFPTREDVSRVYDACRTDGLEARLARIYEVDTSQRGPALLTDQQYETLVTAFEHGYYDVPREKSLSQIAEELDVSHQALSERLRRAHRAVIEGLVIVGTEADRRSAPEASESVGEP
ncbi:helix-turn-helix domain-containing protein [Halalkalicoccus sp. NIPERK01]|uniref:helix-turn-helix domain-containing protein n=1 Tax=Halalkalicoccus sp. NIPERK01 TaxID=3053469 RepID=UPI00256F0BB4|nr:helix-turn-helix domain-containing protein [Halalkalicoccus sp. NIPERK01]MDL5363569.1 helix-turn-helix domain-containing protein [Halalkalicoccus sp. NIPERK01]